MMSASSIARCAPSVVGGRPVTGPRPPADFPLLAPAQPAAPAPTNNHISKELGERMPGLFADDVPRTSAPPPACLAAAAGPSRARGHDVAVAVRGRPALPGVVR